MGIMKKKLYITYVKQYIYIIIHITGKTSFIQALFDVDKLTE